MASEETSNNVPTTSEIDIDPNPSSTEIDIDPNPSSTEIDIDLNPSSNEAEKSNQTLSEIDIDPNPSSNEEENSNQTSSEGHNVNQNISPDGDLLTKIYYCALKGECDQNTWEEYTRLNNWAIPLNDNRETALHIAAIAGQEEFFKELVVKMSEDDLATPSSSGKNALCYVAANGNVTMAKIMLEKNSALATPRHSAEAQEDCGVQPLHMAALLGHRQMVDYLWERSDLRNAWTLDATRTLLVDCIKTGLYDMALKIFENSRASDREALAMMEVLVGEASSLETRTRSWPLAVIEHLRDYLKYFPASNNQDMKSQRCELFKRLLPIALSGSDVQASRRLLRQAAISGNTEFVVELIRFDPDLIWPGSDQMSIFHIAVKHRHEGIFNLHHELGSIRDVIANYEETTDQGDNILHLAAYLPPYDTINVLSGAALQMQREVLWFKEVEKIGYGLKGKENEEGMTPEALFVKNHEKMRNAGEKWMKDTAKSSMIVATLIATVAFSTVFSVPGGFDQSSGEPILLNEKFFWVFSVADGIALFFSSVSLLFFLSILTARYAMNDFLVHLPVKLMMGMTSLFISILAMMISFTAAFTLYYKFLPRLTFVIILYFLFAFLPILYISLNYSLLVDLIRSTWVYRALFQPRGRQLFNES